MNSVHEPGSRIMSKNRLRNNTESNRIENRPSASSAQPVASPRAQVVRPTPRPPAPHAPACPARSSAQRARAAPARAPHARPPARSTGALLPAAPVCAPSAPCVRLLRLACRIVALQRAVSQYSSCLRPLLSQYNFFLYCDTIFLQPSCNTILQYYSSQHAIQTSVLQYKIFQPSLLYCNTMQPLQYNFPLGCNTIEPLLAIQSQPCNTTTFYFPQYDLSSSPSKPAPFFFSL